MKTVVLFIYFLSFSMALFSQTKVEVIGFYINRYEKKEIEFKIKNENLRQAGKSYETMIDYKRESYFFTLKVDSVKEMQNDKNIYSLISSDSNYKNIEFYKFPPYNDFIKKQIREITNENLVQLPLCSNFYSCKDDSRYLYQIYYIQGSAIRIKIENDYLNKANYFDIAVNWDIAPSVINRNIPSFYVYLFTKYDIIDCNRVPTGFIEWEFNTKNY